MTSFEMASLQAALSEPTKLRSKPGPQESFERGYLVRDTIVSLEATSSKALLYFAQGSVVLRSKVAHLEGGFEQGELF